MGHLERGGIGLAIAVGIAEFSASLPLPAAAGGLAISGVLGAASTFELAVGAGESMDDGPRPNLTIPPESAGRMAGHETSAPTGRSAENNFIKFMMATAPSGLPKKA